MYFEGEYESSIKYATLPSIAYFLELSYLRVTCNALQEKGIHFCALRCTGNALHFDLGKPMLLANSVQRRSANNQNCFLTGAGGEKLLQE